MIAAAVAAGVAGTKLGVRTANNRCGRDAVELVTAGEHQSACAGADWWQSVLLRTFRCYNHSSYRVRFVLCRPGVN